MKTLWIFVLTLTALFGDAELLNQEEKQWIQNNRNVKFTGDPNWLPYEAFTDRGHYIGMVADHLDLIEYKTGLHFVPHVSKDWSESLQIASEGEVSLISGDIADKTLNKNFRPIDPYLISPIIIIMDHHTHYVDNIESLKGKKIAIIKDYGYTAELYERYPQLNFIPVANIQEGLEGVSNGKYDAIFASQALARYTIAKMGLDELNIVGKTSVIMSVTLFVDKNQPLLYSIINKAMHSITPVEQEKIRNDWIHDSQNHIDTKWIVAIVSIAFFLILAVLKMYQKANQAKEHFTFAVEGSKDALWSWDILKDTISVSDRFKEILGENTSCACSHDLWAQRMHPDDIKTYQALIKETLERKTETISIDFRMQHKSGSYKWVRMRTKTFYTPDNTPFRMDGVCSDITTEKELGLELVRSRQLLHSIIDNIPIRIFWKDLDGKYLGYNKLFSQDIDGNDAYNFIGKTDHDMPWKEKAQAYIDDDRDVMSTGIAKIDIQGLHTKADGQTMWLSASKVPLLNEKDEVSGVVGVYYDITEHKQHLLENEKKTKLMESAQEVGHMGSWEWNILSGELVWSDEVYRIFGEEPQSFPATYEAFTSYIPAEYLPGLEKAIGDAMQSKKPYQYDHEVRRKDGSIRLVREAGYVRYTDDGQPSSMLGTVLDINSLIEVKSTLSQNKELTELLKKFDKNVIASNADLDGIITYASEAFSNISGYSIDELVGSSQNIVRHPDTPKEVFKDLWKTIQAGQTWHGEIKNRRKDGSFYWVSSEISPVFDENRTITGYSSIRHDITDEKQVEALHASLQAKSDELVALNRGLEERIAEAIVQSQQKDHMMTQQSKLASMGEMIGNIAHQWRQPLNALSLLLQKQQIFFERGLLTQEKLEDNISKGISLINKMSSTIDDFRDFFKPNKEKGDFDIKEAVDSTLELIDASLHNESIVMDISIPDNLIVYGYKNEFSQVILNLINNAKDVIVEKKKNEGRIKLHTSFSDNGNTLNLHICDNGGGIPENVLDQVFEPYFTTKEEGKGTGIGLYMSKMIIEENMHGKISVSNTDEGAAFTISIALRKEHS